MSESTPRFALPFIIPGQAQKEFFHNEALLAIDLALHPAIQGSAASPPAAPAGGQCWIVAAPATGAWAGKENCLALWTAGGWRFQAPTTGMSVWDCAAGWHVRWTGAVWTTGEVVASALHVSGQKVVGQRQPAVPSPSGGTIIDVQARQAVGALIAALMSHGLID